MNIKSKLLISLIGLGAIIIPAVLLVVFSSKTAKEPLIDGGGRTIDTKTIDDAVKKAPVNNNPVASPFVSTSSASPAGGSGQQNPVQGTTSAKPR